MHNKIMHYDFITPLLLILISKHTHTHTFISAQYLDLSAAPHESSSADGVCPVIIELWIFKLRTVRTSDRVSDFFSKVKNLAFTDEVGLKCLENVKFEHLLFHKC